MARAKKVTQVSTKRQMKPALTPEADEQQMISLAMDLVRQRLIDGTASSQETTHFLKLASPKNRLEIKKLEEENKLLIAKTGEIEAKKENKQLYEDAIRAMSRYQGHGDYEEDDEYY